ncbi:hypothetical protein BT63DRAFT_427771 [Microthyrium microscopicum]|uniref:Uncharacterized protein n=1 Tax=Microthyrium microscopicum TaxID=703497 RepID=A0A6A6U3H7_9PEZI|nr:hypothetical protein BT63DRAFT_427771 [Microthyrium microscopicum]
MSRSSSPSRSTSPEMNHPAWRHTNIYDMIADRVTRYGYLPTNVNSFSDTANPLNTEALFYPDELLWRMKNQKSNDTGTEQEYQEAEDSFYRDYDAYTTELLQHVAIPDGDLLEALHTYASDFYDTKTDMHGIYFQLDGSALIALGVLVEEMARQDLGDEGDLALTEARGEDNNMFPTWWNGTRDVPYYLEVDEYESPDTSPDASSAGNSSDDDNRDSGNDSSDDQVQDDSGESSEYDSSGSRVRDSQVQDDSSESSGDESSDSRVRDSQVQNGSGESSGDDSTGSRVPDSQIQDDSGDSSENDDDEDDNENGEDSAESSEYHGDDDHDKDNEDSDYDMDQD